MRMGLREANQRFSKAIQAVKAGHDVVLTERGTPVAVIKALPSTSKFEAAIAKMIGDGRLIGPHHPRPIRRRGWRPIRMKGKPLSVTLREDRDAGW
jgi:antitoxin (DNA-binding transcriptional repressor) of toxin-antitoxin stability system